MPILYSSFKKPFKYPGVHDKDSKVVYRINYRPENWTPSKEVVAGVDICQPTTPTGFIYECAVSGVTGLSQPTFGGAEVTDGTAKWVAKNDALLIGRLDTIGTSIWTPSSGVTLDNMALSNGAAKCRVTAIPEGAATFTLTNHIVVNRDNGDVEEFDRTLIVKVSET